MNEQIIFYTDDLYPDYLNFKEKVDAEGGTALDSKKISPIDFDGVITFHIINDEIGAILAIERSTKYTEEFDVARICRFYILKKYRHMNSGFKMLPSLVEWAKKQNFKLIYWTHDRKNKALNSLYQHKKIRKSSEKQYFLSETFLNFKFVPEFMFVTGKMEQYVYAYKLDSSFVWQPKGLMRVQNNE